MINVKTGQVVGLHFGGIYLDANFAVPAYQLSRDRYVVDAGLTFTEARPGNTEWDSFWANASEDTAAMGTGASAGSTTGSSLAQPQKASGSVEVTIPLKVSFSLGTPIAAPANITVTLPTDQQAKATSPVADEARAAARAAEAQKYFDAAADTQARQKYYQQINANTTPNKFFGTLRVRTT